MSIESTASVLPVSPADRVAAYQQVAADRVKATPPTQKAPFDPTPALRPTIQDKISIDQALLELRTL